VGEKGESGPRFAARHGLTLSCLDYWKRQARATLPTPAVAFAPVHIVEPAESRLGVGLELQLASGDRLFIPAGASPDLVRGGHRAAAVVLTISPAVRIYVATGPTDLRRSIDGLAALVRERFDLDPLFCGGPRSVARERTLANSLA
jgi:hypothetical protein